MQSFTHVVEKSQIALGERGAMNGLVEKFGHSIVRKTPCPLAHGLTRDMVYMISDRTLLRESLSHHPCRNAPHQAQTSFVAAPKTQRADINALLLSAVNRRILPLATTCAASPQVTALKILPLAIGTAAREPLLTLMLGALTFRLASLPPPLLRVAHNRTGHKASTQRSSSTAVTY